MYVIIVWFKKCSHVFRLTLNSSIPLSCQAALLHLWVLLLCIIDWCDHFHEKLKWSLSLNMNSRSNSLEKSWCYIPGIDRVVKTWWRAKEINQRFPRNQICSKACGGWDNERVIIQFLSAILDFFTVKHESKWVNFDPIQIDRPFLKKENQVLA